MKNVYTHDVTYENFAGEEKTQTLHFHISAREFADWMIDHMDESERLMQTFGEMAELEPEEQASREVLMEVMKMLRLLSELAFGTPSTDGEYFSRPSAGYKFSESAAYDAFRMDMFEHPEKMDKFFNTLMSTEVMEEFAKRMPTAHSSEGLALNEDFSDLTEEQFANLTPEQMRERYRKAIANKGGHNKKSSN